MADGAGGLPAEAAGGVEELVAEEVAKGDGARPLPHAAVAALQPRPRAAAFVAPIGPPDRSDTDCAPQSVAPHPSPAARGRKAPVRYSDEVAGRIVARVSAGESVPKACRAQGMPHPDTVYAWARAEPRFGRALAVAHQGARRAAIRAQRAAKWAAGRDGRGRWSRYTPELGEEVCRRIIEGQTLNAVGADPEMPCKGTILNWAKTIPEFEDRYAQAMAMRADVMFEEARDEALAATPGTVWVARLRVDTIFRMVSRMRPRKYCERVVAEEAIAEMRAQDDPDRQGLTVIVKRFSDVTPEEEEAARLTEEGYFDRPRRGRR